jgi:AcrR family transcriptional regulator
VFDASFQGYASGQVNVLSRRRRSFDESDALKKATQVFWSKGYDGVTIDDLVAGMGVGRPSLYAVFGDKRAIFLRRRTQNAREHQPRRHSFRHRIFATRSRAY